jgi:hypothetical protein
MIGTPCLQQHNMLYGRCNTSSCNNDTAALLLHLFDEVFAGC